MLRLLLGTLGAVATLAPAAPASTWVVNAGGGGQFTDIQTAILASVPGDVLLVQPGTYAPFALDRGLTIIGYGVCNVSGPMTIAGVPAGETSAVVGINAQMLDIQSCDGAVIVQDMQQLQSAWVSNSLDVRLARIQVPTSAQSLSPLNGLDVSGSRVEAVGLSLSGDPGLDGSMQGILGGGGVICASSRLHLCRSSAIGGSGSSDAWPGYICGDGGPGLDVLGGADVVLCGRPSDVVQGGSAGIIFGSSSCNYDGVMGWPVGLHPGGVLRHSGVTIPDWVYVFGTNCTTFIYYGVVNYGGTEVHPALPDPTLSISGNPIPGATLVVTLDAPAGSTAVLGAGRRPIVLPDPNTVIELLTPVTRTVSLGTIPAGGTTTINLQIPTVLAPGTKIFLQAEVSVAPGDLRRTNSIPIIVR